MSETFENYPRSIGEIKSDRSHNGADWTPREALIDLLREIDAGRITPDALVICFRTKAEPGKTTTGFRSAAPDIHIATGLLQVAQHMILADPA